jgi:hypothetical protein
VIKIEVPKHFGLIKKRYKEEEEEREGKTKEQ